MKTSELRAWAEREIMIRGVPSELVDAPAQVLIHEVNLHRTELELQNEELQRTQLELEEERDYRVDLFDLSPVASLILDPSGRVVEANTSASVMLGVPKLVQIRRALAASLSQEDGDRLHRELRRAFACRTNQSCEVTIERMEGSSIPVRLDSIVLPRRELCATSIVDVSDR